MHDVSQIKKWYFGINEIGIPRAYRLLRAAVKSCLVNTPLSAHCLYSGGDNKYIRGLQNLGVRVIFHRPTLEEELRVGYGEEYEKFVGHWLRADLPLIETEEQYILYTDIDVLFLKWDPQLVTLPRLLAAAPEENIQSSHKFNSGVMVLNLPNMRGELPQFHAAIRHRLLNDFKYPNHDQKSFNDFFRSRYDALSPLMNWKPYWGRNDAASIVHFHGPKPRQLKSIKAGKYLGKRNLVSLWSRQPAAYDHYCDLWAYYSRLKIKGG